MKLKIFSLCSLSSLRNLLSFSNKVYSPAAILILLLLSNPLALAQTTPHQDPSTKTSTKKTTTKKHSKAKDIKPASAILVSAPVLANEKEIKDLPFLKDAKPTTFLCEDNNSLTVYESETDSEKIVLRWQKKLHELTSIETATGAHRFENNKDGLAWISIASKAFLLNLKTKQKIFGECRNAQQLANRFTTTNSFGLQSDPSYRR